MPLYEYKCVKCGHRFEKIESVTASETKKCPKCGSKAERMASAPSIQFKGSGWYVTDYGRKTTGGDASNSEKGEKAEKTEKSEKPEKSEKSDSKSATPAKGEKKARGTAKDK